MSRRDTSLIPASVIVMTKDEERNIAKCLTGLTRFGQIFVVDSGSADRTCEIAREFGVTVVPFRWNGEYPKKKQWCLDNLPFAHDWVYYVDADEETPPKLADEIAELLHSPRHAGYFVGYDYVFMNRTLRHGRRVYKLVLLDRHRSRFPVYDDLEAQNAGEVELHFQPIVQGSTGVLRRRMRHDDHDSLYHFFERHNRYSDWEAVVHSKRDRRPRDEANVAGQRQLKLIFDFLPAKALLIFLYSYVVRAGFLDGRPGFDYAIAMAFYTWQIAIKECELEEHASAQSTTASSAASSREVKAAKE